MEEKSTNFAWPTSEDSDVPPAEERANHIYIYSFTVVQEQGFLSKRIGDYKNNFLILVINVSPHNNVQATIMIK